MTVKEIEAIETKLKYNSIEDVLYFLSKEKHKLRYKYLCWKSVYDDKHINLIMALDPIIKDDWKDKKHEIYWYVNRCQMKGFCNTDDMIRLCAQRYMDGKRKVNPPGTRRKKELEKKRKKMLSDIPKELMDLIDIACESKLSEQYKNGNQKAINALMGMVLKQYKTEPTIVKELLINKLGGN